MIWQHYLPKGARDQTAPTDAGALVAVADRLDTLVGCFGIGLKPTGTTDPYGLRRACIGTLRTLLDRKFDLRLSEAFAAAHQGFEQVGLDLDLATLSAKLNGFFRDRLRGVLGDELPVDTVDAALGVAADRPLDAQARARAINQLDTETRARVGELFKRAHNIAKDAPDGEPEPPDAVLDEVHSSEKELFAGFVRLRPELASLRDAGQYGDAFARLAEFTPLLGRYFDDVFVMVDEAKVRDNRLRMMRAISETCSTIAKLQLLGAAG